MSTNRALLTPDQFEKLASEFVDELHKVPLYDVDNKRRLAAQYLTRVQTIIWHNITELANDEPTSVKAVIACDLLADH